MEIDNVKLTQTVAISRYIAKEANLAGKDNLEQAQADAIQDTITDGYNMLINKIWTVQDPIKKVKKKVFLGFYFSVLKFLFSFKGRS